MLRTSRAKHLDATQSTLAVATGALLLLSAVLVVGLHTSTSGPHSLNLRSSVVPAATYDPITYDGVAPTAISLSWAQSGDFCFNSYDLNYSYVGSSGPWTNLDVITTASSTSEYVYGLSPSTTYWWQIVDNSGCGGGSQPSNALQVTQPDPATLGYTLPTSSSAQFTWNNNAAYGGMLSFESYQLMEKVNSGSYAAATTITSEGSQSYTVNGLSAGTSYSFYLETTDQCGTCSSALSSGSASNAVSFGTALPLSASAGGTPTSADTGQLVSFTCSAGGGVGPFTYSWTFGDGATGAGQNPSHAYSSSGFKTAVCTVRDSTGSTATSPVSVTIDNAPTVTAPIASPPAVDTGQSLTLSTTATPGSGGISYTWAGLPPGCVSINSPTLTCTPTRNGTWDVSVSVTDSNGGSATSTILALQVVNPPAPEATFLGLPQSEGYGLLAGIIVVAVAAALAVLVLRGRAKKPPAQSAPAPGSQNQPPSA